MALRHEQIHAEGVLFEAMSIRIRKAAIHPLRNIAELKNTLAFIVLDEGRTENLCKFSGRVPPQHVHLPEPVLGRDVALRQQQVVLAGSFDMRHSMSIPPDGNRRAKTGQLQIAVDHRQRCDHRVMQPENSTAGDEEQDGDDPTHSP